MAGMVDNLLGYTCERRAEFIVDGEECAKAFLDCCKEVKKKTQEAKTEDLILARSKICYHGGNGERGGGVGG